MLDDQGRTRLRPLKTVLYEAQPGILGMEAKLAINETSAVLAYLHMAVEDLRDALDEAAEIGKTDVADDIHRQLRSVLALIAKLESEIAEAD